MSPLHSPRATTAEFKERITELEKQVVALRASLTLIASFGGKTLRCPDDSRDAYDAGAAAAFDNCASIAKGALYPTQIAREETDG